MIRRDTMQKQITEKYNKLTNALIGMLETADPNNWKAPWDAGITAPTNPITAHQYTGTNRLMLGIDSYIRDMQSDEITAPMYAGFKQWQTMGASVRKGEKSTPILIPITFTKETESPDLETGKITTQKVVTGRFFKTIPVFHHSQVDGYEPPAPTNRPDFTDDSEAERFVDNIGVILKPHQKAYYSKKEDAVYIPPKNTFEKTECSTAEVNYYSVLFHEIVHWTSTPARCNRKTGLSKDSTEYAKEELIAEIGASFICQDLGITKQPRQLTADYLKSWLQGLKNDVNYILTAATAAEKAAKYLHSLQGNG